MAAASYDSDSDNDANFLRWSRRRREDLAEECEALRRSARSPPPPPPPPPPRPPRSSLPILTGEDDHLPAANDSPPAASPPKKRRRRNADVATRSARSTAPSTSASTRSRRAAPSSTTTANNSAASGPSSATMGPSSSSAPNTAATSSRVPPFAELGILEAIPETLTECEWQALPQSLASSNFLRDFWQNAMAMAPNAGWEHKKDTWLDGDASERCLRKAIALDGRGRDTTWTTVGGLPIQSFACKDCPKAGVPCIRSVGSGDNVRFGVLRSKKDGFNYFPNH